MVASLVPVVKLQDILVVQVVKNAHFIHEFLPSHSVDTLDSDELNGLLLAALVDDGVFAAANLLVNVVVVHSVLLRYLDFESLQKFLCDDCCL